jgi:hypothetical protein
VATAAERRAYARKLREIARSFDQLERATLQQSIQLLRDVRDRIAGQLTGTEFSQFRVAEQQQALDDIINAYDAQARALANGSTRQAFALGERSVVEPLQDANIGVAFFRPSEAQVNILSQFSADLISGEAAKFRSDINRIIRMNALGGNSALDAMKEITAKIGLPEKRSDPTKGVAYEAERILRTETNRTYNLASFAQQEQLAQDIPGLQKQWMATADNRTRLTHLEAHGKVVGVDEPFRLNGAELMYPGDPKGGPSETINCRCRSITVIPEIGPVATPLDEKIEAEKVRRGITPEITEPKAIGYLSASQAREQINKVIITEQNQINRIDKLVDRNSGELKRIQNIIKDNEPKVDWLQMLLQGPENVEIIEGSVLPDAIFERRDVLLRRQSFLLNRREQLYKQSSRQIQQLLKVDNPAKIGIDFAARERLPSSYISKIESSFNDMLQYIDNNTIEGELSVTIYNQPRTRSHFMPTQRNAVTLGSVDPTHIYHEVAHVIEYRNRNYLDEALSFLEQRTEGESEQYLKDLLGNMEYGSEKTKPDDFFHPYVGKSYIMPHGKIATEVISMGLEYYISNPALLAESDPGHFELIYNLVHGL